MCEPCLLPTPLLLLFLTIVFTCLPVAATIVNTMDLLCHFIANTQLILLTSLNRIGVGGGSGTRAHSSWTLRYIRYICTVYTMHLHSENGLFNRYLSESESPDRHLKCIHFGMVSPRIFPHSEFILKLHNRIGEPPPPPPPPSVCVSV